NGKVSKRERGRTTSAVRTFGMVLSVHTARWSSIPPSAAGATANSWSQQSRRVVRSSREYTRRAPGSRPARRRCDVVLRGDDECLRTHVFLLKSLTAAVESFRRKLESGGRAQGR